jgi:hypothetical protein
VRELARLGVCQYQDSASDSARQIEIDPDKRNECDVCVAHIRESDGRMHGAAISRPQDWNNRAAAIAPGNDGVRRDMFVAAAHEAWGYDLLVTTAPTLLNARLSDEFRHLNIFPPLEALKVIGLFLRSRGEYHVSGPPGVIYGLDAMWFYLELLRAKEPRLWRNSAAWVQIIKTHPGVARLNGSLIARCRRALEARDAIGVQFYQQMSWRTADLMLYHFDYLTVLLVGAFDASARIACLAHNLPMRRQQVSFWNSHFNVRLAPCAAALHAVAVSHEMQLLRPLMKGLRNTIHGPMLQPIMYTKAGHPSLSLVEVDDGGRKVWDAADRMGGTEAWGLATIGGYYFEPYTYATRLLDVSVELLGRVADATGVDRLLAPDPPDPGIPADIAATLEIPPTLRSRFAMLL